MSESKYKELGVDPDKKGIEAFKSVGQELYPHAFVKMYKGMGDAVIAQHPDGVGSKNVQRYLHFKETGDASVFEGDAQDSLEMNLGDLLCAGIEPKIFTDYVAINRFKLPKEEYLKALNSGFDKYLKFLRSNGLYFIFGGGETADLPDQLRTYDLSVTVYGESPIGAVVTGDKIVPGDSIIGIRSGGKANFEAKRNSGIMSNGLTLGRHCLMSADYNEKYPETYEEGKEYTGKFEVNDHSEELGMTVGEALVSPTRSFSIMIDALLKEFKGNIHGLVFNTGGGQTKCKNVGRNMQYVIDRLPEPDPIFYMIQEASGESWENMHKNFNMGIGLSAIAPAEAEGEMIDFVNDMFMDNGALSIGYTAESDGTNRVKVKSRFGEFNYAKA